MPCLFVCSSVCGKSGFSSLKLSENEAGRDCHLCFLWRFRWPWWTVLCRTRGANLRSKSSKSTGSRGRKTSPSPPIWRRTSSRASEIEPRMWATRLNPQGKNVVRTTRFLQTNDSKTITKPRETAGSKNAIYCRICMNLLQEETSSLYEKLYIYISHVSPLFFLSSFASSPCSFISKNLLLHVTTASDHRETFQMQPLRCRLLWRQHSWVVSSRPSTTTCSMPRRQTTAQAVLSEAQFIRQKICGKSKDQRQFASQPRPAQWQFLDRMSKCGFDSLWRTVLRLRYRKSFSIFLNLKSSYHLSFCNSGGDSRAVLCAGLNSPLQSHPNKAGYTTITTQGYAFLKQHLCISL